MLLKELQKKFDERVADILLPYCDIDDWEYFPIDYIRKKIVPTKNASDEIKGVQTQKN